MKKSRRALFLLLIILLIATVWLWWVRPRTVDMAGYAPADSLLYLEANQPAEVLEAIAGTDAWKALQSIKAAPVGAPQNRLLQRLVRWTGIGPIQSVILARAQVAVVVTDLGTREEADSLKIRPEAAMLIETHTAQSRIKPYLEQTLKALAEKNYGRPIYHRSTIDGVELISWSAPEGSRQLVGATIGSLVIVGNNEQAVQNCLAVSLQRRPSLKGDPELDRMRRQLAGENLLTFGFVPTSNTARLLAVGVPLLMGRAPGDSEFQALIAKGATKIFGSVGWTSRRYLTGMEDRYLITLQPSVAARLKPVFGPPQINSEMQRVLPDDVYSVTSYKFINPAATWQTLKMTVSSEVDTLSTIVFSSLLKSSLLSYGITDPESFLAAVNGELLTLRLDENSEHSILIAGVRDRTALRELVTKKMGLTRRNDQFNDAETFEDSQGEFAASFIEDSIIVGSASDVRRYAANRRIKAGLDSETLKRITFFVPASTPANIVTYVDDGNRVRNFASAVIATNGGTTTTPGRIEQIVASLPFSATETTLDDRGIERITRSPLGQFSTFFPLLVPEPNTPGNPRRER